MRYQTSSQEEGQAGEASKGHWFSIRGSHTTTSVATHVDPWAALNRPDAAQNTGTARASEACELGVASGGLSKRLFSRRFARHTPFNSAAGSQRDLSARSSVTQGSGEQGCVQIVEERRSKGNIARESHGGPRKHGVVDVIEPAQRLARKLRRRKHSTLIGDLPASAAHRGNVLLGRAPTQTHVSLPSP